MENMKSKLIIYGICMGLLLVISSLSIARYRSLYINRIDPSALSNEVTIKRWNLIGPFKFAQSDINADNPHAARGGLNHDFLVNIGYREEKLSANAITSICSNSKLCLSYTQHGADLLFDRLFPGVTYAVIYATAEVISTEDADVGFELGSHDGVKVWINGNPILATRNDVDRSAFKYTHLLLVHLNKGANLLVVKIDQKVDAWALISSFMSLDQMRSVAIEQADGNLISDRLLTLGESLHMSLPSLCNGLSAHLSIENLDGTATVSSDYTAAEKIDIKLPQIAEGYYSLALRIGAKELHDSFYIGNSTAVIAALSNAQLKAGPSTQDYLQRDPLIRRYRILTSDQYSHPLDPDWQKKLLLVLKEGIQTLHYPTEDLWSKLPGMHLRQYISKIDGTPQNYLLFIPAAAKAPLPLVLITPYAQKPVRPFLESSLIAWPDDLEDIQKAADTSGVIVALSGGRGNVGDSPIGEVDAFEVLNDTNSNYSIDKEKIYLYGTCEGGRRALLLAEHYPGLFAAIGVYGPKLTADGSGQQGGLDDPFVLADKLSSTPVFLVKGEYDDIPPTADLDLFCDKLKESGSVCQTEIIPDGMHKQKKVEQIVFPFLVKHRIARSLVVMADEYKDAVNRANAGRSW